MQALITHLRKVTALPSDVQKRALGPHLAGYITRMERLYTSLEQWERDYNAPVLDVPIMISGSQDMALLVHGVAPNYLQDMLDITGIVQNPVQQVENLAILESKSIDTINAKLKELDGTLQPYYVAFVGQHGGRLPDAINKPAVLDPRRVDRLLDILSKQAREKTMDVADLLDTSNITDAKLRDIIIEQYQTTTVPIAYIGAFIKDKCKPHASADSSAIVKVFERSDVHRNLQAELGRLDNIRKYIARLNAIVDLTVVLAERPASLSIIGNAINMAAIEERYSAIEKALLLLNPRCCNCANSNSKLLNKKTKETSENNICTRHVYCEDCNSVLSNGCPICYYEIRLIVHRSSNIHSKNILSSEFCTPVNVVNSNNDINCTRDI